jgi:hypothetical protein
VCGLVGEGVDGETGGLEKAIADLGRKEADADADDEVNGGAGDDEGDILTRLNSALRFWHSWAF